MRIGIVFSQADSGTDAAAIRRWAQAAEEAGCDPATLAIHGRVYLGEGWQRQVDEALELGFADLSFGFNRMATRGLTHDEHLAAVIAAKPELDRLVA